jgi:tetratricopeptide (TPR) repeat protein
MRTLRRILWTLFVLLLAGVVFFGGRWMARKVHKPAVVIAEKPSPHRDSARDFVDAALAERFAGRPRSALAFLQQARVLDPQLPGLEYQFGMTHLAAGDLEEAENAARLSLQRGEEESNAMTLSAQVALERGRRDGSLDVAKDSILARLEEARLLDPLNPAPLYVAAELHRATGQPDLAAEAYGRALQRVSKGDTILLATVKAGVSGLRLNFKPASPPRVLPPEDQAAAPEELFFVAADALLRDDQTAALAALERVRPRIPPSAFVSLLQDPFFRDYLLPASLENLEKSVSPE